MTLRYVIWKQDFADKMAWKHGVTMDEVEEALFAAPHVRYAEDGRVKGEDLYVAYGRTDGGRYLTVFFVQKSGDAVLPISARDMTQKERRYYDRHRHT